MPSGCSQKAWPAKPRHERNPAPWPVRRILAEVESAHAREREWAAREVALFEARQVGMPVGAPLIKNTTE